MARKKDTKSQAKVKPNTKHSLDPVAVIVLRTVLGQWQLYHRINGQLVCVGTPFNREQEAEAAARARNMMLVNESDESE